MTRYLKQNAVFVINCSWDKSEIEKQLPAKMRKDLAEKKAHVGTAPRDVAAHNGVKDLVPDLNASPSHFGVGCTKTIGFIYIYTVYSILAPP